MTDLMVWVDLETTGLPDDNIGGLYAGGDILELGMVVTTADLTEVARERWLYAMPHRPHTRLRRCGEHCTDLDRLVSPTVRAMHERSGLWADLERAHGDDWDGDPHPSPLDWLDEHASSAKGGPMCGSSVHFDREWLKHLAPVLEAWFGHRNVDVSSWRMVHPQLGMHPDYPVAQKQHRALPDIADTIAEARFHRSHLTPTIPARGPVTPVPTIHEGA